MTLLESLVLLGCIWSFNIGAGGKATEECTRQYTAYSELKIGKEHSIVISSIYQMSKS